MWLFIFSWLLLNLLMFNIFNSSILLSNNTFSLINLFSSFNIHINVLTFSFNQSYYNPLLDIKLVT